MACPFAERSNACGCVIGYAEPLQTTEAVDITNYPVHVLNVAEVDLGIANTPSEYVTIWNSDAANQAFGVLRVGTGAFCFFLTRIVGVTPPSNVLGTFTPPPPPTTFDVDYGYTELDTTGPEPVDADYVASLPGTAFSLTGLISGADVQIDDFQNPSDKVLYVKIPDIEAAFTKWSEVGNPLQQDQPIDPDYATGSNVFYKSATVSGFNVYFSRSQTTFTGAVVLSR